MPNRSTQIPSLERVLVKLRKQESSVRGKLSAFGYASLDRIESHPLVRGYAGFSRGRTKTRYLSEPAIDLDSLFVFSLIFHLLLLVFLTRVDVSPDIASQEPPIVVRIETGQAATAMKQAPERKTPLQAPSRSRQPPSGPATPRPAEPTKGAPEPVPAREPEPSLALPGPRALGDPSGDKAAGTAAQPLESLVQLPTRSAEPAGQPSDSTKRNSMLGINKESGSQVPAALQRGGAQDSGPATSPNQGSALASPDFAPYLKMIETRVRSAWKYPEGMAGSHDVSIVFVLDKSGNLTRAEIVDSSDSRLNPTAVQAMRTAAPFPPIPETLRELAGEPLRIRFKVDLGIKSAR